VAVHPKIDAAVINSVDSVQPKVWRRSHLEPSDFIQGAANWLETLVSNFGGFRL
jgi:hypothetical protein